VTGHFVATAGLLLGYAVLVTVATPPLVTSRRWSGRLPRTAVMLWMGALGTSGLALVASLVCMVGAASSLSGQPGEPLSFHDVAGDVSVTVVAWVMTALGGGGLASVGYRTMLAVSERRRVARGLPFAAGTSHGARHLTALVVDSQEPHAVSVPGRRPMILVSSRLRESLTPQQLEAVVEHERGHLLQHHHLFVGLADLQYRCAPTLPSARSLEQSVHLLVELAADDHAARRCGCAVAATALRALGEATGDHGFALRAHRLERRAAVAGRR